MVPSKVHHIPSYLEKLKVDQL